MARGSLDWIIRTKKEGKAALEAKRELQDLTGGLNDAVRSLTGLSLTSLTAGGAIAALGAGVANFTKQAVEAAAESEVVQARLGATLKATNYQLGIGQDELEAYANKLQRVTGISDESIINAEALLATFEGVNKEAFEPAIRLATDLSAVMGTDLNSAVMMLGKALQDPVTGMTALRRAGVVLTAQQRDAIEVAVKANDMFTAQGLILGGLEGKVGGAAEALGNTYTGQVNKLQQAWDDLLESFGKPIVGPGADFLDFMTRGVYAYTKTWQDEGLKATQVGALHWLELMALGRAEEELADRTGKAEDAIQAGTEGHARSAVVIARNAQAAWDLASAELAAAAATDRLESNMKGWQEVAGGAQGALGKYLGEGTKRYMDGLKVIDEVMGTNLSGQLEYNKALEKAALQFTQTGDKVAYADALGAIGLKFKDLIPADELEANSARATGALDSFTAKVGGIPDNQYKYVHLVTLIEGGGGGGGGGGGKPPPETCCFLAGTLVSVPGGTRAIEQLCAGDQVLTYVPETGEVVSARVSKTFSVIRSKSVTIHTRYGSIVASVDHPFLTEAGEWVKSEDLCQGLVLRRRRGCSPVMRIDRNGPGARMYNFEIDHDAHTYIVNGFVVHNYRTCQLGGEGTVPPGYWHDNFPIFLSSGEKYKVTPSFDTGRQGADTGGQGSGVTVQQMNISTGWDADAARAWLRGLTRG